MSLPFQSLPRPNNNNNRLRKRTRNSGLKEIIISKPIAKETKVKNEEKETKNNITEKLIETLQGELKCSICLEVPVIPVSLSCPGEHITCLDCFVRLRMNTYKICQGGYKARVELISDHKDKCPQCRANIDLSYATPNNQYKAMIEMYKTLSSEYKEEWDSYKLCKCDKSHNKDIIKQLQCASCTIPCPFDKACTITHTLHGINEANMLSAHLKVCTGVIACFECHMEVKNSELQGHLSQHRKWTDFIDEMSNMQMLMFLDSSSLRCFDQTTVARIIKFWTLFKTVVFRHLSQVDDAPVIDPFLEKIENIISQTNIIAGAGDNNDEKKKSTNILDGLKILLNTDDVCDAIRHLPQTEAIRTNEVFEDFLTGVQPTFENTEDSFKTIVAETKTESESESEQESKHVVLRYNAREYENELDELVNNIINPRHRNVVRVFSESDDDDEGEDEQDSI